MDLSKFRTASDIFVYKNLRDFEKVLFLEHNVKELITLLKRKDNFIKEIQSQLDRVITEYEEGRQIKALKAEITSNQRVIAKYKKLLSYQIEKNTK